MAGFCGLCQCEVEGSWEEHAESQQHQAGIQKALEDRQKAALEGKPAMTETEAQEVAAKLGLHYDGIQGGVGHQFTDREETTTTFYGNTPSEVEAKLVETRKLFDRFKRERK